MAIFPFSGFLTYWSRDLPVMLVASMQTTSALNIFSSNFSLIALFKVRSRTVRALNAFITVYSNVKPADIFLYILVIVLHFDLI